MFKLGSYLLFITFAELISVILFVQSYIKSPRYILGEIHPLIYIIILIEICFSVYLLNKGYSKLDKMG